LKRYEAKLTVEKDSEKLSWLHGEIAELYEKEKKYKKSEEHFRESLSKNIKNRESILGLGDLLLKTSKFNELIELSKKGLANKEGKENYDLLHLFLGKAYSDVKLYSKAGEEFKLLVDGDYSNIIKGKAYYHLGVLNSILGQSDIAIKQLEKSIKLDPTNPEPYADLGVFYGRKNKLVRAKSLLQKSISLNPDIPEVYFSLGQIYELENKKDMAIEAYTTSVKKDDDLLEAHYKLALAFIEKGNFSYSRYHLNKIRRTNSLFTNVDKYLGKIYIYEHNYAWAKTYLLRGLKLFPKDPENLYYLSIAYGNDGESIKALKSLLEVEKLVNKMPNLFSKIADLYLITGKNLKAEKYYRKELKNDDKNGYAYAGLAKIEAVKKKPSIIKVVKYIKKARKNGFKDTVGLSRSPYLEKIANKQKIIDALR
jgi:tetratricopeptide (TPR) repeat protein